MRLNGMTTCHSILAVVVSTLCIGAVGCNGPQAAPTASLPAAAVSFAGSWQGALGAGSQAGARILQLEITQAGENLTGRWTLASAVVSDTVTGDIGGRVIGAAMAAVLTSAASTCPTTVGGTLETGTRVSATYSTFSAVCPNGVTAPIVLEKH
jgi:hypothetical protein